MPNSQIYPATSYPGAGDLLTTPGSPDTRVVGLQTVPIVTTPPLQGQVLAFLSGAWTPSNTLIDNSSLEVNGVTVSDDYWVFVNRKDTEVQVNSAFAPNGFPILVAGSPANTF